MGLALFNGSETTNGREVMDKQLRKLMRKELPNGRVIVDERCTCGLLRSEHGGLMGHGGAPDCLQFTWIGWVFEDEMEGEI